jgi:phosphate transport system permease protein
MTTDTYQTEPGYPDSGHRAGGYSAPDRSAHDEADTVASDSPVTPPPSQASGDGREGIPEERVRLRGISTDEVLSVLGSAAGALALDWLLSGRLLPFSGAVGFWVCGYLLFLAIYSMVAATQWGRRVVATRVVAVAVASAAVLVLVVVANQIVYVTYRGFPALQHGNFFTQSMSLTGPLTPLTSGGMLNGLVGSLEQLSLATLISVPLGVTAALFLSEIGGRMARPVRVIVEAMVSLPEIIAGLFIYVLVVVTLGLAQSGFAASMALAVMMIPIVTRASEVMLRLVPAGLREASYALGSSQWRTVWNVVLPTARAGLVTAVLLGMARAVGETAPVLLASTFTKEMNANPFNGPQTSLPLYIWTYVRYPQATEIARAFGAALALMLMVLVLFVLARVIGGTAPGELSRHQLRRLARDAARHRQPPPAGPSAGFAPAGYLASDVASAPYPDWKPQ